ncbi:trypsin-like serine protease [Spongiactinospora sp. TRM90649]|uniref:trypsin-like serine peptidase n=1 Tax=Spongiactinospora sp. TRM90649 TaxID=3031114 RepID=UPI0023F75FC2|nr:trypsin-like serine protease [Spongiactinospora sp. TRM90649]MDF5756476.1 trypsin-like serine protease [Spongiactinospora sp. TRM90649]
MSPHARRLTAALGGLAAAGALVMSTCQGTAQATVASHGKVPDNVLPFRMAATATAVAQVEEYWKPERLKAADDATPKTADPKPKAAASGAASSEDAASAGGTGTAAIATTATTAAATASAGPNAPAIWAVPPAMPKKKLTKESPATIGKVYFRVGGKDFWCSASAVNAKNRSLVATAAHCAFDLRTNKAMENWIFVPSYRQGTQDAGLYVGHTATVHMEYSQGDYDYDYAFVTVYHGVKWQQSKNAKGQVTYKKTDVGPLQDNVGGQGITAGRPVAVQVTAFGYPAGPQPDGSRPYNGHTLKSCSGLTSGVRSPTYQLDHGIAIKNCDFTAGASGGPWLTAYSKTTGTGLLAGINSLSWNRKVDGKNDHISSAYFGAHVRTVYGYAETVKAR